MARLFISYSRKDEEFARRLAQSLSELGADVWIDVEDIPAGMKWSSAIQQGLDICEALIVIISPDSMVSNNVEDEWQYYFDQKKPVIPILYRPAKVHFQLSRIQYINFHTQDYGLALRQLHSELRRQGVNLNPIPSAPVTVPLPPQKPLQVKDAIDKRVAVGAGGGVIVLALLIFLFMANRGGLLLDATPTPTFTASFTSSPSPSPTRTFTRTPRPTPLSPTDQAATDQALVELEETYIYLTEVAPTREAQQILTLTAESFTDTPTPNYRQTAYTRQTATRAALTQAAGLTATQNAIATPTPTSQLTPVALECGASPPSRLNVGMRGAVAISPAGQDRENLNVRDAPAGEIIEQLPEGTAFYITGEPQCAADLLWWPIETTDGQVRGWSAEGQLVDGAPDYFITPLVP